MLPPKLPKAKNRTARWKSLAHCTFIRKHQCSVQGCTQMPIEVAHLRIGTDAGMGRKASDFFAISLCRDHHAEQHGIGEATFAAKYRLDLHALAEAFANASPKAPEIKARKREMAA